MTLPFVVAAVFAIAGTSSVPAQELAQGIEQGRYQESMEDLAEHLGTLHHLRGSCMEAERQTWRDYMQELIRLEAPSADRKTKLVGRFNDGYDGAKRRYRECDRNAAKEAERVADLAADLTDAISATVKY